MNRSNSADWQTAHARYQAVIERLIFRLMRGLPRTLFLTASNRPSDNVELEQDAL